jgi:hypothetical protein
VLPFTRKEGLTGILNCYQDIPKFLGSHPEMYLNKQNIGPKRQKEGVRLIMRLNSVQPESVETNVRIGSIRLKFFFVYNGVKG